MTLRHPGSNVPGTVTGNHQFKGSGISRSCDKCLVHHDYYAGKWQQQRAKGLPRRWFCAGCNAKKEAAQAAKEQAS